ncbi:hypothetical protein [Pseudomonas sp.]|uniref:hypothetical protein n=1 Tax=Pseudomonas sp. TaxID=306 RepID=UPI002733E0B9|nr:hypothetical protein [Pseudomonas sp.]MDP2747570.1 hypothetical protein [Pseudomonas sp.]
MSKSDPVNIKFYIPLARASLFSDLAFFFGAILSILSLYVDKANYPASYVAINTAFAIAVTAVFISGLVVKLYYFPRAEDERIKDFLSHAYGFDLTCNTSDAYYNNNAGTRARRIGAQLLENSLFSKEITSKMLKGMTIRYVIYLAIWLSIAFSRDVDYSIVLVASQVLFAEQVMAKFIRLAWLHSRCERTYEQTYKLFLNKVAGTKFECAIMEYLVFYETSKTSASIQLSSRAFKKVNPALSSDWDSIRKRLDIDR